MSGGTFNVSRRIWDHPVFKPSKYSEREAFLWMVSEASWRARTIRSSDGKNIIDLDRSQLSHSLRFMADKWGWTKSTAERFLKKLEKRDMIKTSDGTAQNIITVCNYDEYQNKPSESGTADGTQGGTDAGQTRDKEEEGLNKGKKAKGKKLSVKELVFNVLSNVAGEDAVNGFIEMRWNIREPMTERSAKLIANKLEGKINADAILDLSTENNWKSVFPDSRQLKESNNGQRNHNGTSKSTERIDPALEQIARLSGISAAPGNGGC